MRCFLVALMLIVPVLAQAADGGPSVTAPSATVPSSAASTSDQAAVDDPIVYEKGGMTLHRSQLDAALHSLPPEYRDKPIDELAPIVIRQMLRNRNNNPFDALRD